MHLFFLKDSESHTNHISDSSSLDEDKEMVRRDLGNRGSASLITAKVCHFLSLHKGRFSSSRLFLTYLKTR